MASTNQIEAVRELASAAGVAIGDAEADLLSAHLNFVLEGNSRARLTAIRNYEDGLRLHVLDSLMVLPYVVKAPGGAVLDMGSGGGYPGIPIAVLTGRAVTLVDSVAKKMRLIQEFIDEKPQLAAVTTASVRLEVLGDWVPDGGFGVVVARALSSLPALVELAAPLLSPGGHLICMKGDLAKDELLRGNRAARTVGLTHVETRYYVLPGGAEKRAVVVYQRTGKPKIRLPRREGMAQRKPLA